MTHFNLRRPVQQLYLLLPLVAGCFLPSISNAQFMQRCLVGQNPPPPPERKIDTAVCRGTWAQMQQWAVEQFAQRERGEANRETDLNSHTEIWAGCECLSVKEPEETAVEDIIRPEDIAGLMPEDTVLREIISSNAPKSEVVMFSDEDCLPCRNPWSVLMDCSNKAADSVVPVPEVRTEPVEDLSIQGGEWFCVYGLVKLSMEDRVEIVSDVVDDIKPEEGGEQAQVENDTTLIWRPCYNPWSELSNPEIQAVAIRGGGLHCAYRSSSISELENVAPTKEGDVDRQPGDIQIRVDSLIVGERNYDGQVINLDLKDTRLGYGCRNFYLGAIDVTFPVMAEIEERDVVPILLDGTLEAVAPEEVVEEAPAPEVKAEPGIR